MADLSFLDELLGDSSSASSFSDEPSEPAPKETAGKPIKTVTHDLRPEGSLSAPADASARISVAQLLHSSSAPGNIKVQKQLAMIANENAPAKAVTSHEIRAAEKLAAREATKEDASQWQELVRQMRTRKTVRYDSKPAKRPKISSDLAARTPIEQQLADLLAAARLDRASLNAPSISVEAAKKDHAEMARLRARMSYIHAKTRRWKKIKSRSFRKAHSKSIAKTEGASAQAAAPVRSEERKFAKEGHKLALMASQTATGGRAANAALNFNRRMDTLDGEVEETATGFRGRVLAERKADADAELALEMSDVPDISESSDGAAEGDGVLSGIEGPKVSRSEQRLRDSLRAVAVEKHDEQDGINSLAFVKRAHNQRRREAQDLLAQLEKDETQQEDARGGVLSFGATANAPEVAAPEEQLRSRGADDIPIAPSARRQSTDVVRNPRASAEAKQKKQTFTRRTHAGDASAAPPSKRPPVSPERPEPQPKPRPEQPPEDPNKLVIEAEAVHSEPEEPEPAATAEEERERAALLREAFSSAVASEDLLADKEKEAGLTKQVRALLQDADDAEMPGWGSWTGPGIKTRKRRSTFSQQARARARQVSEQILSQRKDADKSHVFISEKIDSGARKLRVEKLPHGFETAEQFNALQANAIGPEWSRASLFQSAITPQVTVVKRGKAVEPVRHAAAARALNRAEKMQEKLKRTRAAMRRDARAVPRSGIAKQARANKL